MKGQMTITHAAEDDTRAIERDFQKSVKKLMSNNELEESIDGVEEVTYIGNRTEQTYSFTTSPIGTESINRVGDEDGVASIIEAQVVREDSGGRSSYTALAVCVSVGAAFVLIIAFLVQKKLRQGTEHEVDFEEILPDGKDDMFAAAISTVDFNAADFDKQPGSFHLGQCHYTKDGIRYISPSCPECQGHGAPETPTGGEDEFAGSEDEFVMADPYELGKSHSINNVHICQSAVCPRCQNGSKEAVAFVKVNGASFHIVEDEPQCVPVCEAEEEPEEEPSNWAAWATSWKR